MSNVAEIEFPPKVREYYYSEWRLWSGSVRLTSSLSFSFSLFTLGYSIILNIGK